MVKSKSVYVETEEPHNPMRILHVLDRLSVDSGVSAVVLNYYKKIDTRFIIFDFMLNEKPDEEIKAYLQANGSKLYIMPALKAKNLFKYIKSLKAFYKNHHYQIIHGHVANSAIFYLGLARNVPFRIIHSHSTRLSDVFWKCCRNWILTRFIKKVANRFLACSQEAAKSLFGTNTGITIINNAIDLNKFHFSFDKRKQLRSEMGFTQEFLIGSVGRFCVAKNHKFIIHMFDELYKKKPSARLILIGDGELKQKMIREAEKYNLGDAIVFLGTTDQVNAYMSALDVLILPSLFEGLGLVGVEAQACGLYVLASKNVPSMINITGLVDFLPLEISLWVEKLLNIDTTYNRIDLSQKVRHSIYDIDTQAKRLCAFYLHNCT